MKSSVKEQVLHYETFATIEVPTPAGVVHYCPRDGTVTPQVGYVNSKNQRMVKRVPLAWFIYEKLFGPLEIHERIRFKDKDRSNLALRNLYVKTTVDKYPASS